MGFYITVRTKNSIQDIFTIGLCRPRYLFVFPLKISRCLPLLKFKVRTRCPLLPFASVCQWLETGRWFSLGTPVSSTIKTDRHDINEILFKVALNTINQTKPPTHMFCRGFMFYLCYLYLFTIYTYVQHNFYIKWYSYHLTVTRRVWHVEQELLTSGTPDFTHGF